MKHKVTFKSYKCYIVVAKYGFNQTALLLVDQDDGSPVAKGTVCLPDANIAEHEVAIKDYSENTGMLEALVDAGIIDDPHRFEATGHVSVPICKLLISNNPENQL